jgi:hypothetical protein
MKYLSMLALPLCAALLAACGSSHTDSSTSGTTGAGGAAATQPASSMGGSGQSGSMQGQSGSMQGQSGSMQGHSGAMHGTSGGAGAATFPSEEAAAAHCPSDTVVWLNTHSRVYHMKGSAEYGKTKHGGYACAAEADAAGAHKSKSE